MADVRNPASAAAIETLNLFELPTLDPAFAADPLPHFALARERHPWLAKCAAGYVVHQMLAMDQLLRRDDVLSTSFSSIVELMEAQGTPWGRFTEEQITGQTGETHRRIRGLFTARFTPRQAERQRGLIGDAIRELLDDWAPREAFDFEEFASYFPITVMCRLLGASPEVIPGLRASMEALGLGVSLQPALLPTLQQAIAQFEVFADDLVRARGLAGEGANDLLDVMLRANAAGALTDREVRDLVIFLFVAGYDTSKNVLTLTMNALLDRPEIYRRCAEDSEYCGKVIEESLRFFSVSTIFRIVREDFSFRGVLIPRGTMLFFPLSVSGRDPAAYEDADAFDPDRAKRVGIRHVAFGRGAHICLGQFLARAQLSVGLHEIARRVGCPRRVGSAGWRPFHGVWGLHGLPIAFEDRAAATLAL